MDIKIQINELLRNGYTQKQIASLIGVSQPAISLISRGVVKNPSFHIGAAIMSLPVSPASAEEKTTEPEVIR
ncbi:helix-turn-helix domain-containing protein [Oxalobacter formigenes]